METQTLKLLLSLLLLLFAQGNGHKCNKSSIQIQQTNIGKSSNGLDFIFEVEVKNLCKCSVKSIFINSLGFVSSMQVDPKLFRQEGSGYLVKDGQQITSQSYVKFRYAWAHYFKMTVASIQPQG
ncbi:hypothetical protein LUZ60_007922 [Juncus effusus]|nr:hypothetical protein LUZ60_007922 [Juncus effusus]